MTNSELSVDQYGGTTQMISDATEFFTVRKIDGRWWFITPEGHGFISMGMNHLDLSSIKYPDNIHIFNERYGGSNDRFITEGIAQPLKAWGFNTLGWSQEMVGGVWGKPGSIIRHSPEWTPNQFRLANMPFVYNLAFAEIEKFNNNPHYPNVFDSDFDMWADHLARSVCVDLANDPLLLGYADLPLPDFTRKTPGSWAEHLNFENPNDMDQLKAIVDRYFEVTTQAIKRYDPNHLIFGPRFSPMPENLEWVIEAAGKHFDALLCNWFISPDEITTELKKWHKLSHRPILISDMAFLAPTDLLEANPGGASYVPDQKARGIAYRKFNEQSLRSPYILGHHWCAFFENLCRKSGIKNHFDEPYWDCVNEMKTFNCKHLYATAMRYK